VPEAIYVGASGSFVWLQADETPQAVAELVNKILEVVYDAGVSWPECPNLAWPMAAVVVSGDVAWLCSKAADVSVPLGRLSSSGVGRGRPQGTA
jgi:hypothetical protein